MRRPLLCLLLCLGTAAGAAGQTLPRPGDYVGPDGKIVPRPVPRLISPDGKVIPNPAAGPAAVAPVLPPPPTSLAPLDRHQSSSGVADDGGITLNFVDADVRDVARAVLGDFLGLNYAVGANVTGTVTIQTSRPVAKADALAVLEQALQLNGLALVKQASVYNIIPLADARKQGGAIITARQPSGEPGFGVQIVPLKYIGAAQMQHLLEPLVPSQAVVYADGTRNVLVIQGSEAERAAMVEEIGLFDVDWLSKMSFALLTPKYTDVMSLTREMNEILGGEHAVLKDFVRLVPIQRLNAVLAISSQPRYLAQLQQWVERLDQPGRGYDRRLFFYAVQNSRAADLADALNRSIYGAKYKSPSPASDRSVGLGDNPMDPAAPTGPPAAGTETPAPANAAASDTDISTSPDASAASATITVDKANNALLIYGTPQQYAVIADALHHMDVAPVQIQLEAVIAEVTLNDGLEYGVQYFYKPSNKHEFVLSNGNSANITPALPGFSYIFTQGTNIQVILSALSQVTRVEVVSSPNVMVLNNGTASLQVGNQVPVSTGQAVSVSSAGAPIVNSIEYRATGVILKVTPSVNKSGLVTLDVIQEVSNVAPAADQTGTLGSPTFAQRRVTSTVAVHDNETVALGGLISNSRTKGSSGIPFLSAIPVLGGLFGTKQDNTDRTELMILITPHVVENLEAARAVTEELRQKFPSIEPLLRAAR
ncbi:MAG: type II secretion system secretin GspD [Rhizomicrobium sp.]